MVMVKLSASVYLVLASLFIANALDSDLITRKNCQPSYIDSSGRQFFACPLDHSKSSGLKPLDDRSEMARLHDVAIESSPRQVTIFSLNDRNSRQLQLTEQIINSGTTSTQLIQIAGSFLLDTQFDVIGLNTEEISTLAIGTTNIISAITGMDPQYIKNLTLATPDANAKIAAEWFVTGILYGAQSREDMCALDANGNIAIIPRFLRTDQEIYQSYENNLRMMSRQVQEEDPSLAVSNTNMGDVNAIAGPVQPINQDGEVLEIALTSVNGESAGGGTQYLPVTPSGAAVGDTASITQDKLGVLVSFRIEGTPQQFRDGFLAEFNFFHNVSLELLGSVYASLLSERINRETFVDDMIIALLDVSTVLEFNVDSLMERVQGSQLVCVKTMDASKWDTNPSSLATGETGSSMRGSLSILGYILPIIFAAVLGVLVSVVCCWTKDDEHLLENDITGIEAQNMPSRTGKVTRGPSSRAPHSGESDIATL